MGLEQFHLNCLVAVVRKKSAGSRQKRINVWTTVATLERGVIEEKRV